MSVLSRDTCQVGLVKELKLTCSKSANSVKNRYLFFLNKILGVREYGKKLMATSKYQRTTQICVYVYTANGLRAQNYFAQKSIT